MKDEIKNLIKEAINEVSNNQIFNKRWLSVPEAAKYLTISESKIRKLIADAKIPFDRVDKKIVFSTKKLDLWILSGGKTHFTKTDKNKLEILQWRMIILQNYFMEIFQIYKEYLKAKQTDLFISDIPYGIFTKDKSLPISKIDPVINICELEKVLDFCVTINGTVLLFCDFELLIKLKQSFQKFEYRYHYILEKSLSMPSGNTRPINNVEYIAVFKRKNTKVTDIYFNPYNGEIGKPYIKVNHNLENPLRKQQKKTTDKNESGKRWIKTVIQIPSKCNLSKLERSSHKFQKPEFILRKMIQIYSIPDSLIVDGFAGSGSTLLSAYKENRRSIGFEIDKDYYNESKERIKTQSNQLNLM